MAGARSGARREGAVTEESPHGTSVPHDASASVTGRPASEGRADALALIPVEDRPFNAETPLPALLEPVTPTPLFYVRNHFDVPHLDEARFRLRLCGLVERPLELRMEDVRALPQSQVTATLECAGNGRTLMTPRPGGTPWGWGAVSTALFAGTPLREVLHLARLRPEAADLLFTGADRGKVAPGREEPFARSLPREAVGNPDVILAWEMNGEPLTADHGFPLRLVVPGWYGVASVKCLVEIRALAEPFRGYFQGERYVYEQERGVPDGAPVAEMWVRSLIARPIEGAELGIGPVEIAGVAWSGEGPVVRVDVSADGGATWAAAELEPADSPHAGVRWRFLWQPQGAGEYELLARAADAAGNEQPLDPVWNAHGYGNNVVQRVRVRMR
jgi:DMSO/TMAO reductase YedYZ molybdopterin-dependent catalytic subunit